MRTRSAWLLALTALALLNPTGCTLKATFETTTDATSNFLSSTTPGAWVTEDGLLRAEHKVTAFTTVNRSNLEKDIAAGQGEYLASMGALLGVPSDRQPAFFSAAQARYARTTDLNGSALPSLLRESAVPFVP